MNDTAAGSGPIEVNATEEFVWRRLTEPFKFFNYELPAQVWVVLLAVVLTVALVYVVWMYIKDSKTVGPWWATLLGFLRTCVYAVLAVVFLLPAIQKYLITRTEAKVIVVNDVSISMHTSDTLPSGDAKEKLPTRMDRVLEFLRDKKVNFLANLEAKNPVTVYRLGSRLDESYLHFAKGMVWTKEEKENPDRDEDGTVKLPERKPLNDEYWTAWLQPHLKLPEASGLNEREQKRYEKLSDLNAKAIRDGLIRGTNLGDSLLSIVNKELNNRVQGIVVFTDGRNTEGSPNAFRELEARAKAARVPIFVVGVGEDRLKVKIEIVDVRAPQQIQPEDKFRVKTEVTGEGLGGEKLDVTLEITHTRLVKKKVKGPDGKFVEQEEEESLPLELIEAENPDDPKAPRTKIALGDKLILPANPPATLDKGTPPRLEVEWQLDAAALAAAAKVDLANDSRYRGKKWEIAESKDDSEIKYVVRVPVDKREGLRKKVHESTKVGMKVIKKPIRVLLLAAAANRDFQFVRTLLMREMEKKRLELAICYQVPPGETKARTGVVMDVPPERLLRSFPDTFRQKKDLYDLSSYDVIIGFDPDWKQIDPAQTRMLKDWAEKGGGLILVGGYINTVELIRPREGDDADRFKPVLDLLPVVLDDRRDYIERSTDDPWALDFEGANPEMEFLKLDEELDETKFKEDWMAFFYGEGKDRTEKAQRGFYSFYPVQRAKQGSLVIARFTDPATRLKDNTLHPYIVASPEALARVIWIGSAETWRLREYREAYHERFWTKLVRYAAAKSKGAVIKSIRLEAPTVVVSGRYMEVEAKIDGPDGQPLDRNKKPQIRLKMPPGVADSEVKQPVIMTPRPGVRDGWFSGRFLVKSPGGYELTVTVPKEGSVTEGEQSESAKFTVKEANPELDNTRPDFDRMYRMSSEADEVLLRMSEGDRNELKRRLVKPKIDPAAAAAAAGGEDKVEIREDRMRLYFDLKNAELIPSCMVADVQEQKLRGKYQDLWDDGFTVYEYPKPDDPTKQQRPPVKIAYVLLAVVGLLSMEWLIRKLLRLA
jgi:hypothetical protein